MHRRHRDGAGDEQQEAPPHPRPDVGRVADRDQEHRREDHERNVGRALGVRDGEQHELLDEDCCGTKGMTCQGRLHVGSGCIISLVPSRCRRTEGPREAPPWRRKPAGAQGEGTAKYKATGRGFILVTTTTLPLKVKVKVPQRTEREQQPHDVPEDEVEALAAGGVGEQLHLLVEVCLPGLRRVCAACCQLPRAACRVQG